MPTHRDQILAFLADSDGCDDCVSARTGIHPRQTVNQRARELAVEGRLKRFDARCPLCHGIKLVTSLTGKAPPAPTRHKGNDNPGNWSSEDSLKKVLKVWLENDGWDVEIAWGNKRGIDIEARRGAQRWIIEVKGGGSRNPMRVNYFLAILGETLQRMNDPDARYSIALPDLAQHGPG